MRRSIVILLAALLCAGCASQAKGSPQQAATPNPSTQENRTNDDKATKPQKLETAEQAIARARVVLSRQTATRYEATHLDAWMPTVPTSQDNPRAAWKVRLFDAADRSMGWVVLDETTGEPLQVGDGGNG